jgi:hypothetical protein
MASSHEQQADGACGQQNRDRNETHRLQVKPPAMFETPDRSIPPMRLDHGARNK